MKQITAKEFYAGSDPETGESFSLEPGQTREVSDAKFEQIKRDFPEKFDLKQSKEKKSDAPGTGAPPTAEQLAKDNTLAELADLAGKASIDVENVQGSGNDGKVVKADIAQAIVSAREGRTETEDGAEDQPNSPSEETRESTSGD